MDYTYKHTYTHTAYSLCTLLSSGCCGSTEVGVSMTSENVVEREGDSKNGSIGNLSQDNWFSMSLYSSVVYIG